MKFVEENICEQEHRISSEVVRYVKNECLNESKAVSEYRKALDISNTVIQSVKDESPIKFTTAMKILRKSGKLNNKSVKDVFSILLNEYISDFSYELLIYADSYSGFFDLKYKNMTEIFSYIHRLSGMGQIEILVISRTYLQNVLNNRPLPSPEKLNRLFWFYYKKMDGKITVELIENFLNLLCIEMLGGAKMFKIELKIVGEK